MSKIDSTVKKETAYIAMLTLIFSVLMQSVFMIVGKWNIAVLYGNLIGYVTAVGNFLLLGLTVQTAVTRDEKGAKKLIRRSQALRYLMQIAVVALCCLLCREITFIVALVIPFLFPRIAIAMRPLFKNY